MSARKKSLDSPPSSSSRGKICGLEDIVIGGRERSKGGNGCIKYGNQGRKNDVEEDAEGKSQVGRKNS